MVLNDNKRTMPLKDATHQTQKKFGAGSFRSPYVRLFHVSSPSFSGVDLLTSLSWTAGAGHHTFGQKKSRGSSPIVEKKFLKRMFVKKYFFSKNFKKKFFSSIF
jgi:hypothetical protein